MMVPAAVRRNRKITITTQDDREDQTPNCTSCTEARMVTGGGR